MSYDSAAMIGILSFFGLITYAVITLLSIVWRSGFIFRVALSVAAISGPFFVAALFLTR